MYLVMSIFEMSHFNHVLFLTVNILIPGYNLPVLTILLFYILTYELNYKANYHFILFKFIIHILSCPLLFILFIQGNNPTVPIYILFSTQLKKVTSLHLRYLTKRQKSLHLAYRSIACTKLKLVVYIPIVLNKYTQS